MGSNPTHSYDKPLPAIDTSLSRPPEISIVEILNEPNPVVFPHSRKDSRRREGGDSRVAAGSTVENDIAPFLMEPPTPPPKSPRHLAPPSGQQQQPLSPSPVPTLLGPTPSTSGSSSRTLSFSKAGFTSFTSLKSSISSPRQRQQSEARNIIAVVPPPRRSTDGSLEVNSRITLLDPSQTQSIGSTTALLPAPITEEPRSSKSSGIISFLKRQRSRTRLSADSISEKASKGSVPPLPDGASAVASSSVSITGSKKEKKSKKSSKIIDGKDEKQSSQHSHHGHDLEMHLDTDLSQLDGIVDMSRLQSQSTIDLTRGRFGSGSPVHGDQFHPLPNGKGRDRGSGAFNPPPYDSATITTATTTAVPSSSSGLSATATATGYGSTTQLSYPQFSNPFKPSDEARSKFPAMEERKVSPTSLRGSINQFHAYINRQYGDPGWTAPDSWDVEPGNDYSEDIGETSSDDGLGSAPDDMSQDAPDSSTRLDDSGQVSFSSLSSGRKKKKKQKEDNKMYSIKVYLPKHEFRIAQVPLDSEVRELAPLLLSKTNLNKANDTFRIYLKERGRERMLAGNEKPAKIVRKRLLQAGYEPHDGLDALSADGSSFLVKFEFKTQFLREKQEDIGQESYSTVDLEGRGLRTIPVRLHQFAESIITLKLSRNPMLDIPLDFVQACTSLRELRLQNMAIRHVPQSIRRCTTLHKLDMSSNWLSDLDKGYLDELPSLAYLYLQNNRLSKLPWYTPRLYSLVTLNLSNNKFQSIPATLTEVNGLRDLDMSFNQITDLSENIGKLRGLERLVLVANQIKELPKQCGNLINLRVLDVRRNRINDVSPVLNLPKLRVLQAEHNHIRSLDLSIGPLLSTIDTRHNQIITISLSRDPQSMTTFNLTALDISYSKISEFPLDVLGRLTSLRSLKMNHNLLPSLPESIGSLTCLQTLSFSYNRVDKLPKSIGSLQMLETLEAHHNRITELPAELWQLASLTTLNVSSNFIRIWHLPAETSLSDMLSHDYDNTPGETEESQQESTSKIKIGHLPLVHTLKHLFIAENQLEEHSVMPLMMLRNLRLLNLSYNKLRVIPSRFFAPFGKLTTLYLSGNGLASMPAEDLWRLVNLTQLYLNANMLTSLPIELAKIAGLKVLEVSCNRLRYNINNWEFDWNWNFNSGLISLNLSGNPHLVIKSEGGIKIMRLSKDVKEVSKTVSKPGKSRDASSKKDEQGKCLIGGPTPEDSTALARKKLSGFGEMHKLCVLGLMDVTISVTGPHAVDIPEETEDRRVRTTLTTVGGMPYGISDSLGENMVLGMFDLAHEFHGPGHEGESVFAMFGDGGELPKNSEGASAGGGASSGAGAGGSGTSSANPGANANLLAKFLHDRFIGVFRHHLDNLLLNERAEDAIRRTYLTLNKQLHDWVYMSAKTGGEASSTFADHTDVGATGAVGVTAFFSKGMLYVANVGDALAVISKQGAPHLLSRKHDPFDSLENKRMRGCEGWVSTSGAVNDEVRASRAFGYFQYLPTITAAPDIFSWPLTDEDDVLVIANRAFWDIISFQLAIDIARVERADPMLAAAKLRDVALAHGATDALMVMVINVSAMFGPQPSKDRRPTLDDHEAFSMQHALPEDHHLRRMEKEVEPPTGHLALVFTDIQNSTHLWETNASMSSAIRIHNNLLRRELRLCGGYEVKTEGDAFMVSFSRVMSAVWWCLKVQEALLDADWPADILESEDGKPRFDDKGKLVGRGLSVRMGIHCGTPLCERDPVTFRMDYFGPMVNRSARVSGCATGGQIMVSAEVLKEIEACNSGSQADWTPHTHRQPRNVVDAVKRMKITIHPVGDIKLKGLEHPEYLSSIYSNKLVGRLSPVRQTRPSEPSTAISVDDIRQLGILCLRLEALASGRVYRVVNGRKRSAVTDEATKAAISGQDKEKEQEFFIEGDDRTLLPPMENISDQDLVMILDSFCVRIQNTLHHISMRFGEVEQRKSDMISRDSVFSILQQLDNIDPATIQQIMSAINAAHPPPAIPNS